MLHHCLVGNCSISSSSKRLHRSRPARVQALPRRTLWRSHHSVDRYPTELWGMQATQPAQAQLLIVPGNPGCAAFYHTFMQQLHAAFGGTADVMAVSHVGHDADNISRGVLWGLDCQVEHKAQLLRQHLLTPGKPPLVILAHSIGSYIVLKALQKLASQSTTAGSSSSAGLHSIAKVFLLMPFLATDWSSWEQRVLAAAARHHGARLAAAAGWVQGSPGWVQDGVAGLLLPGAEPHAADTLRAALNHHGCLNNWHMAAQEFSELDGPVDWGLMQQLGSKAAALYNPSDPWFQQHAAMHTMLPGIEAYSDESLGHAFCLSTAECQAVAQLVHRSVTQGAAAAAPASTSRAAAVQAQKSGIGRGHRPREAPTPSTA